MRRKRIKAIFTVTVLTLALCGCKESAEKKYSSAQALINQGKYSEAVEKLQEINSYEDASKLLLYASANEAAVEGNFAEALKTLESLGDYKDTEQLILYYGAKQLEAEGNARDIRSVVSLYESIPLFRDSKEQEESYLSNWYAAAVEQAEAENYLEAYEIFENLGEYNNSQYMVSYYEARKQEASGDYGLMLCAKETFDEMQDIADCAERSKKIEETLSSAYKEAEKKFTQGDYEKALNEFGKLGRYADSTFRVEQVRKEIENKNAYDAAVAMLEAEDYAKAVQKFGELGEYKDSAKRKVDIQKQLYQTAEAKLASEDYENAITIFTTLGTYEDSTERVRVAKEELENKTTYDAALEMLENKDYAGAIQKFSELSDYKDAAERKLDIQKGRYEAAEEMLKSEDFEGAIAEFTMLGAYEDSAERVRLAKEELENKTSYDAALEMLENKDYAGAIQEFSDLGDYKDAAERKADIQKSRYEAAEEMLKSEDFEGAIAEFTMLGTYEDSAERVEEAIQLQYEKADILYANGQYQESSVLFGYLAKRQYIDSAKYAKYAQASVLGEGKDYQGAIKILEKLGDYKESKDLITYYEALEKVDNDKSADIEFVVQSFSAIKLLRDSSTILEEYQKRWYDQAVVKGDSGDYEEAIQILKALREYADSKTLSTYYEARKSEFEDTNDGMISAVALYETIPEVRDSEERYNKLVGILEEIYTKAEEDLQNEDFFGASATFESIINYRDAQERIGEVEEARKKKVEEFYQAKQYVKAIQLQKLEVGDIVKFGEYEQDNNQSNGREPIEWIVMDVSDEKALLFSLKAIEKMQFSYEWTYYNNMMDDVYPWFWETSTLRKWLNNDFINVAFAEKEQESILLTKTEIYPSDGSEVLDRIFIFGYDEVYTDKYFKEKDWYNLVPTEYAFQKEVDKEENNAWWVRQYKGFPSYGSAPAFEVVYSEELGMHYDVFGNEYAYVRPALWIDLRMSQEGIDEDSVEMTTEDTSNGYETTTDGGAAGNINPSVIENLASNADYLYIEEDSNTSEIKGYYYLIPNGDHTLYDCYASDGTYIGSIVYGTAKQIIDSSMMYDGVLPNSGGKQMLVWNSPYGICAYYRSIQDYYPQIQVDNNGNSLEIPVDVETLPYLLDEGLIYQTLEAMNLSSDIIVPISEKEE